MQHTSTLAESRRRRAAIAAGSCDCVIRVPVRRIPVASQVNVRHTTCGNRLPRSLQRRLSNQAESCHLRICPATSPYPSPAYGPRHPRLPVDRATSPSFACLWTVVAITNTITITITPSPHHHISTTFNMASEQTPEAKELSLVGKVEMRIALASSDKKLEDLLKTYLSPLLLKLGSTSPAVRNKVRAQ